MQVTSISIVTVCLYKVDQGVVIFHGVLGNGLWRLLFTGCFLNGLCP